MILELFLIFTGNSSFKGLGDCAAAALGALVAAPCGELDLGFLRITGGGGCLFPDEELLDILFFIPDKELLEELFTIRGGVVGVDDLPNGDILGCFLNKGISNKYSTGMNFVICSLYVKLTFKPGVSISSILSPHS